MFLPLQIVWRFFTVNEELIKKKFIQCILLILKHIICQKNYNKHFTQLSKICFDFSTISSSIVREHEFGQIVGYLCFIYIQMFNDSKMYENIYGRTNSIMIRNVIILSYMMKLSY